MSGSALDLVLSKLERTKRSAKGWMACCPAHDDRNPSLSVTEGSGGRVLVKCHAECSQEDVLSALKRLGIDRSKLSPNGASGRSSERATYTYRDAEGEPLFQVVRRSGKKFFQRHRCSESADGWTNGLGGNLERCGCPRVRGVLYHLPEVIEAVSLGKRIYVVEGEKDADRLRTEGLPATTNAGGASKWRRDESEALRDARVVVLPDNDDAGRQHAEAVRSALEDVAEDVRVVELPGLPAKGDVSDWLDDGHTVEDLLAAIEGASVVASDFPPPMDIAALREVEEPEEAWLVDGLLTVDANTILAAYPKTFKTMFLLELAVALATATPCLGRYEVPERRRVGLVLMEDRDHRVRRRLERLCLARGLTLDDLEGWLFLWFRPPLQFDESTVAELGSYVDDLELDFMGVDSWSYIARGDSNDSDEVTPQLQAFAGLRKTRPGITLLLVHHARKDPGDGSGQRLTDIIRNSSAFGAWYDTGIVLSRKDEESPVTARIELRDHPAPESFAFTVQDEHPAGPDNSYRSSGWLALKVSDHRPAVLDRIAAAENLLPAVREYLELNPGCSKRSLREGVKGRNPDIVAALELLVDRGDAQVDPPDGPGKASRICLTGRVA